MMERKEIDFGGRPLIIETGHIAKQANGAVLVRQGDTVVMAAVVATTAPAPDLGFFPLMAD